jgi:hypothetical protein
VGWPVQDADIVAQVGTCVPVEVGEGDGEVAGVGVRAAETVGEVWTAVVVVEPQDELQEAPTSATASVTSPTLRLTRRWNEAGWMRVTDRPGDTGAQGYGEPPAA